MKNSNQKNALHALASAPMWAAPGIGCRQVLRHSHMHTHTPLVSRGSISLQVAYFLHSHLLHPTVLYRLVRLFDYYLSIPLPSWKLLLCPFLPLC